MGAPGDIWEVWAFIQSSTWNCEGGEIYNTAPSLKPGEGLRC